MAFSCVLLLAWQMMKKSATASGIFLKSRLMIFSPFFSDMALTITLKILLFLLSLAMLLVLAPAFNVSLFKLYWFNFSKNMVQPCCMISLTAGILFFGCQPVACIRSQKYYFFINRSTMPAAGFSFTVLDSVDSTNNYAMAKVHAGLAKQGVAFFSHEQTGGKGQRGSHWYTGRGQNIALSVVLEPAGIRPGHQFYLSVAVALACYDFFCDLAGGDTFIKWPNDLFWRDRKAGGVLIENVFNGNSWRYAIVGIGININQQSFSSTLKQAVSLRQITGREFDVVELAKKLHVLLMNRVQSLTNHHFESLLKEYNRHLYKVNQTVKLRKDNITFETTIRGVSAKGHLLTRDAVDREFDFGEVEWVF